MGAVRIVVMLALAPAPLEAAGAHGGKVNAASDFIRVERLRSPVPKTFMPACHGDRFFTPGAAELDCRLTADGRLSDCVVVSEQPADCAYGQAALRLVENMRVRAPLEGRRTNAEVRVRVPFRFQMKE